MDLDGRGLEDSEPAPTEELTHGKPRTPGVHGVLFSRAALGRLQRLTEENVTMFSLFQLPSGLTRSLLTVTRFSPLVSEGRMWTCAFLDLLVPGT